MELNPQIINNISESSFVILPFSEFQKLKEIAEDYEDLIALRAAKSETASAKGKSARELLNEFAN